MGILEIVLLRVRLSVCLAQIGGDFPEIQSLIFPKSAWRFKELNLRFFIYGTLPFPLHVSFGTLYYLLKKYNPNFTVGSIGASAIIPISFLYVFFERESTPVTMNVKTSGFSPRPCVLSLLNSFAYCTCNFACL